LKYWNAIPPETAVQSTGLEPFLRRLPLPLARSFTPEQLAAIELHFAMRYRVRHAIDWRARIGFPFVKIYFVLLAGIERRPGNKC
jgi:hypothetical protein